MTDYVTGWIWFSKFSYTRPSVCLSPKWNGMTFLLRERNRTWNHILLCSFQHEKLISSSLPHQQLVLYYTTLSENKTSFPYVISIDQQGSMYSEILKIRMPIAYPTSTKRITLSEAVLFSGDVEHTLPNYCHAVSFIIKLTVATFFAKLHCTCYIKQCNTNNA